MLYLDNASVCACGLCCASYSCTQHKPSLTCMWPTCSPALYLQGTASAGPAREAASGSEKECVVRAKYCARRGTQ